jgi:hypothetical protein
MFTNTDQKIRDRNKPKKSPNIRRKTFGPSTYFHDKYVRATGEAKIAPIESSPSIFRSSSSMTGY